jgi:clan AA aspartic protease (TIGR02281 family)
MSILINFFRRANTFGYEFGLKIMKMFPLKLLFFAASYFLALSIPAASGASSGGGTLREFFAAHGFGGAPLQRRFGNHLFVNTVINGRNTALMVDTGCPFTLIDRTSARRIGLELTEAKSQVTGITGNTQPSSVSRIATLAMGNCTFQNVPAEVATEQDINRYARPHLDGLFGAHEMAKFGMIIDCGRQMLYVNPRGPSPATSQALASFLQGRGFVRVPMHFNPEHHLEVDAAVNLRAVKLIVDTGAFTTTIAAPYAEGSGAAMDPSMSDRGQGIARLGELRVGNFTVNNAEVFVANVHHTVGAGLLGQEYLSFNFAVIDMGGMALYLRHAD